MPFYPFLNPINSTIIKMLVLVKTPKDISKVLGESITQTEWSDEHIFMQLIFLN